MFNVANIANGNTSGWRGGKGFHLLFSATLEWYE